VYYKDVGDARRGVRLYVTHVGERNTAIFGGDRYAELVRAVSLRNSGERNIEDWDKLERDEC